MIEILIILGKIVISLIILFWLIPLIFYMGGSMFMKGAIARYFELLNKYKNGKKEKK